MGGWHRAPMVSHSPTTALLMVTAWIDPSAPAPLRARVRATCDVVDGEGWDRSCDSAEKVLEAVAEWFRILPGSHDEPAVARQPLTIDRLNAPDHRG